MGACIEWTEDGPHGCDLAGPVKGGGVFWGYVARFRARLG